MEVECFFTRDIDNVGYLGDLEGKLTVVKHCPSRVMIQLKIANKFVTLEVSSDEHLKVNLLDGTKEFHDIGLRF